MHRPPTLNLDGSVTTYSPVDGMPQRGDADFGEDEDQYQPVTESETGGLADEGEEPSTTPDDYEARQQEKMERIKRMQDSITNSIASAYGPNAEERYKDTPAIGLARFAGHRQDREPSYDSRGHIRGYRSAPGAPMAHPPEGLIGGRAMENAAAGNGVSSLTPQSEWDKLFPGAKTAGNYGPPKTPITRAPIISKTGNSGGFASSYQGGVTQAGFAY